MYRKFNWGSKGSLGLPTSSQPRRLSFSSSYEWTPSSPTSSYIRPEPAKEIDNLIKNLKPFNTPITLTPTKTSICYNEHLNEEIALTIPVEEIIVQKKTDFQEIKILKTKSFGKCFISENHIQSSESDECIYHESIVHPALLSHPFPEMVFIAGGIELATAREVLKHNSVKKVVMVDIDKEAVELCLEHLSEWNDGVIDDPRLEIIYADTDAYLKTCGLKFDVLIMDVCNPTESSAGWKLFTKEFYQRIKSENMVDSHSIFCTQSTGASVNSIVECFSIIHNTLASIFTEIRPFRCEIASFGCFWGFHICCDTTTYLLDGNTSPIFIDNELHSYKRLGEGGERTLRHYDGSCHLHMFNLTKYEKEACFDEARMFTLDTPDFMNGYDRN